MKVRMMLAAAVLAASATTAVAAVGDPVWVHPPPDPVNFPRPMPNKLPPPELKDWWQSFGQWLQPKLGLASPGEWWI